MREYKFRAWHESDKEMVYFNNSKWGRDQYQSIHLSILMRGEHEDGTLMQYTGLNDCNDKEIYEGDIVKVHSRGFTFIVVIDSLCPYEGVNVTFTRDREARMIHNPLWGDPEIIGNIHENSDLIN